jgi:7-cyano-7-deazaguanine synthase in queuosine biosynthesis
MITVAIDHRLGDLPQWSNDVIPVQIYGLDARQQGNIASIGNSLIDRIKRLGVRISSTEFDFMTIALAVTAADTFVQRKTSADGWARDINLQVSLHQPTIWQSQKETLEKALHFLSGDLWHLEIKDGGYAPPNPYTPKQRYRLTPLQGGNSISLFSGGLDSAIGAIDFIEDGHIPLLVSHAYKGDKSHQEDISRKLLKSFLRFSVNANPLSVNGKTDITMRTRSLNFLAFGTVGAYALSHANNLESIQFFVPENGFISLNAPLTPRRIGSLSTRTTHPYFLDLMQSIFDAVGIKVAIVNPYQFKTKGEMLRECKNQNILKGIVSSTVSCSKWKRKRKQCGKCVPCIIRRAALMASGIPELISYEHQNLTITMRDIGSRDDLFALITAIKKLSNTNISDWISDNGSLSYEAEIRDKYKQVFVRGMREVEQFLHSEGII